jgi:hypothetical protein
MPLMLAQPELAKDGRLRRIDAAALVAARESSGPVDQVEVVFENRGRVHFPQSPARVEFRKVQPDPGLAGSKLVNRNTNSLEAFQ